MKRCPTPLLKYVMRHHHEDDSDATRRAAEFLESLLPEDTFSQSQWRVGLQYYVRRIEEVAVTNRRLLLVDLGCGSGNWSIAASELFKTVVGVDVNVTRLNAARRMAAKLETTNVRFYECPIEAAPVINQTADCVLLCNVLPYVQNWRASLRRAVDFLHDDGSLLVGWVDFGMIVYILAESVIGFSRSRMFDLYRMTIDRTLKGSNNRPALWIPKRRIWEAAAQLGLHCAFRDEGVPLVAADQTAPTLPPRFAGTPFYHEVILRKQAIQ